MAREGPFDQDVRRQIGLARAQVWTNHSQWPSRASVEALRLLEEAEDHLRAGRAAWAVRLLIALRLTGRLASGS